MNKINTGKILIPVDFSKTSLNAIKYGAFMAQYTKGELVLMHVQNKNDLLDVFLPAVKLTDITVVTDFLAQKLEAIATDIKAKYNIKVSTFVTTGNTTSEIVALADETKSTLIVMGTHGKDSENGFFLGSNAYRVLSKSEIPVMTVQTAAEKVGFQNILLPLDSSHHSRQKVDSAIYMAEIFGATLHVIGVLHEGSQGEENYKFKMETIMNQIKVLAEKQNVKCETGIQFTDSRAKATLSYAESINADLIIAMTDQDAEFSSIVLGNYIHQLTNESKVPVLSIPPQVNPQLISDAIGGLEY